MKRNNTRLAIRNVISLFTLVFMLGSCSTAKQPYFFSTYSIKDVKPSHNQSSLPPVENQIEIEPASLKGDENGEKFLLKEEIPVNPQKPSLEKKINQNKIKTQNSRKADRPKTIDKQKIQDPVTGDKKKNKFAVAGYAFAYATVIIALLSLSTGLFILALPTFILGLVFSILGLKSEKRKLAKEALRIFGFLVIVGFAALLIFALTFEGMGNMVIF